MKTNKKKTFEDWCNENERFDILGLWDYELNNCNPNEVGFYDKEKRYLKCERNIHNSYLTRLDRFNNGDGSRCLCKKCISIKQYLIDKYGEDKYKLMYSDKNEKDLYDIAKTSKEKFYYNCINCGYENYKSAKSIHKKGLICDRCSDNISYPEKIMFNVLEQLDVEFEKEYSPQWINPKRYDFYLHDYNIIIEMDGGFGHGNADNKYSTIEEQIKTDNYKDKIALQHGIYVIRIKSIESNIEYISNEILNSYLSNIFDMSKIDWKQADINSSKSVLKDICDLWNDGNEVVDICKIVKLSYGSVVLWLQKGNKYGLCKFNSKERLAEASRRNGKLRESTACGVMFNNKLYKFNSALDLQNKSLELFGVEFKRKSIYGVLSERRKTLFGFKIIKL